MPDLHQPAPDFTLPADDGRSVTLSELAGAPVVLFFYPRDDTPGCTTEAQDFTARLDDFAQASAQVFGISKDTLAKHAKFREKRGLQVVLLSDADTQVCEDYGVWVEKNMYGKKHMGIERATFLIDASGKIAQIWRKVKVPGHVDAVLEAVRSL